VILRLDTPPDVSKSFTTADYYVAASRAKHVLHVVSEVEVSGLGNDALEQRVA